MLADTDIQVWLDSQPSAAQTVVIPYVKTITDRQLNYRLIVIQIGKSGTSRISQGGTINADAAQPIALSRLSLGLKKEDACSIEVTLREDEQKVGNYRFDCPR